MEYKMKVQNQNFIYINEVENEFQKMDEIYLSFNNNDAFGNGVIITKSELHKLIGTLLHIQSKMK